MLQAIFGFLLLWLIHAIGWFLVSAFFSIMRGEWDALSPRSFVALGFTSSILQILIQAYIS